MFLEHLKPEDINASERFTLSDVSENPKYWVLNLGQIDNTDWIISFKMYFYLIIN